MEFATYLWFAEGVFQDFGYTNPLQIDLLVCGLIKIVEIHLEVLLSKVIFKMMLNFWRSPGGFRVAYVIVEGQTMIWLHVFKKTTQKRPLNDLDLAEKRMKEVLGL